MATEPAQLHIDGGKSVFVSSILFVCLCIGFILNFSVFGLIWRNERNGCIKKLLINLLVSDVILLSSAAVFEVWATSDRKFLFGNIGCASYQAVEVIGSTAMIYFTISFCFHSLSSAKFERNKLLKRSEEEGEIQSSRRSLVGGDASTPPRGVMKYEAENPSVSFPMILVWVLSISLSVPKMLTSRLAGVGNHCVSLDPVDSNYTRLLLNFFCILLPLILIVLLTIIVILALAKSRRLSDSRPLLLLSLLILITFFLFCLPRLLLITYNTYKPYFARDKLDSTSNWYSHLDSDVGFKFISTYGFYFSCLIRPVMYITTLPSLRKVFIRTN